MSNEAADYIRANSKVDVKNGTTTISVTQKHYTDFMKSNGVEPEVLKAVDRVERDLVSGCIDVASTTLVAAITAARDAGDDPSDLRATVKIARPQGAIQTTVHGLEHPRNVATGEILDQHGRVKVRVVTNRMVDQDAATAASDRIRAAMTAK